MRIIPVKTIEENLYELIGRTFCHADSDVMNLIQKTMDSCTSELERDVLSTIIQNDAVACQDKIPLCQDTGTAVIFAEIGEEVFIEGGLLSEAINSAVQRAWKDYYLRPSIVTDPLFMRKNTQTNLPAVIHIDFTKGDKLILHFAHKGGGAENMSILKMLKPTTSREEIIDLVKTTVIQAGGNPCPPIIVGIGIGGNFETCALNAKKALFLPLSESNSDPLYADLERNILIELNKTGIGAQGLGGKLTALAVHIIAKPCHIASLPIAINLECHAHRHGTIAL